MTHPCDFSASEARRLIGARKLSPVELLESCLQRIEKTNPHVNAIVALDEKRAIAAAKTAEKAVHRGDDLSILHGLPIGIKDLQATMGLRTTWGSLLFEDHIPTDDAACVAQVRNAGGIILAKTNTPEFGAGANTTNRVYGPTGNPFNPRMTCGGSSGGSAVALALGQVALATGSDYGGSLRTPAGFCGIVGFRPSPGVVPAVDRVACLSPWSVIGPMGRTVTDAHLLLRAQINFDRRDPFSSRDNLRIAKQLTGADLASLTVAFSPNLGAAPVDRDIAKIFASRCKLFRHVFREAQERAPDCANVHEVFEIMRGVAFVAQHRERLETSRQLLDRNVIDNTERGLKYSLADVSWAHVEQTKLYKRFLAFFEEVDLLICPAASVSPFPHGELFIKEINGEQMPNYMRWLAITYIPTMALACAAVLPCGLDHKGMPFGIQIIGRHGADVDVLEAALSLEHMLAQGKETTRPIPDLEKLSAT
jgi:Asp-tRNA(Asn)/Glu-tRNA(Gln) amidotransferase A subunit family amidase